MVWHALGQRIIRDEVRPVLVTEQGVYDLDLVARVAGRPGEAWSRWLSGGISAMLNAWTDVEPALAALADKVVESGPKFEPLGTGTKLCAPYRPTRIFATASNYVEHAQEMVYSAGLDLKAPPARIGVSCRICERDDCSQRAFPPVDRRLVVPGDERAIVPFQLGRSG